MYVEITTFHVIKLCYYNEPDITRTIEMLIQEMDLIFFSHGGSITLL